jgi:hypothetical protein
MRLVIGSGAGGATGIVVALEERAIDSAADVARRDHLRRCTFRRLSVVRRGSLPVYTVDCLYPDRLVPIPLGDLVAAADICGACLASHVFRPDED